MKEDPVITGLAAQLPKAGDFDSNYHQIKPVYDVANNKLHYQTDPFIDQDGVIKVKRLHSFDVKVEQVGQVIEEYSLKEKYDGTK